MTNITTTIEEHCKVAKIELDSWKYKALFGYFGFVRGKEINAEEFQQALKKIVFGKIG